MFLIDGLKFNSFFQTDQVLLLTQFWEQTGFDLRQFANSIWGIENRFYFAIIPKLPSPSCFAQNRVSKIARDQVHSPTPNSNGLCLLVLLTPKHELSNLPQTKTISNGIHKASKHEVHKWSDSKTASSEIKFSRFRICFASQIIFLAKDKQGLIKFGASWTKTMFHHSEN